jgi:hypothetical protein
VHLLSDNMDAASPIVIGIAGGTFGVNGTPWEGNLDSGVGSSTSVSLVDPLRLLPGPNSS